MLHKQRMGAKVAFLANTYAKEKTVRHGGTHERLVCTQQNLGLRTVTLLTQQVEHRTGNWKEDGSSEDV